MKETVPRSPATAARYAHANALLAGTVVVLLIIAYRDLLGWDPGRDLSDEASTLFVASDTSPFYIVFLSALFLNIRIKRLRSAWRNPAPSAWGWMLLVPAGLTLCWAQYTAARDILLLSALPMILGVALVAVGRRFTAALLLPVLFLAFAYPTPAAIANQQVYATQIASAEFVTRILEAVGVAVMREGDLIYLEHGIFEVIETCSGLRLIETLVTSAFAYSEFMGTRRSHEIIIIMIAPILGFLLNAVRILMIMFNPLASYSSDHTLQGLVVIVVGVVGFAVIESILKRFFPGSKPTTRPQKPRESLRAETPGPSLTMLSGALFTAIACVGVSIWMPEWRAPTPMRWSLSMGRNWDGWKSKQQDNDKRFLGSVYFSRHLNRIYEKDGQIVEVFAARDDRNKRDRSLLSPKTGLPGSGWKVLETRVIDVDWTDSDVHEIIVAGHRRLKLIYHWYEGTPGLCTEMKRAVLGLENSELRLQHELRVFRVSTNLPSLTAAREAATERVEKFARKVRVSLDG